MTFAQIISSSSETVPPEPPVEFDQVLHLGLLVFATFGAMLLVLWLVIAMNRSIRRRVDKQAAGKATGWWNLGVDTTDTSQSATATQTTTENHAETDTAAESPK